jgi:hypothetical protein
MGEQPDRPSRTLSRRTLDTIAYRSAQWYVGGPQEIAAPELRQIAAAHGPEPATRKHAIQLIEIHVDLGNAIGELVLVRLVAPMAHDPLVHRTGKRPCHAAAPSEGT